MVIVAYKAKRRLVVPDIRSSILLFYLFFCFCRLSRLRHQIFILQEFDSPQRRSMNALFFVLFSVFSGLMVISSYHPAFCIGSRFS